MSLLYIKDNPVGIDTVVNELNSKLFDALTTNNGWENYSAYHRA